MDLMDPYQQTEVGAVPADWKVESLGSVCHKVTTGALDVNAMNPNGQYRFYTCAENYYFIDTFAFDTEALLVSGNGANVGYVHYYKGKFNAYQRTYVLSSFDISIKYVQYYLSQRLAERIRTEVKASNTPYITRGTLTEMTLVFPPTKSEQDAIAEALSDADAYIESLEQLLAKKRDIKQGAMQDLLTGKRRLPGFDAPWNRRCLGDLVTLSKIGVNPAVTPNAIFTHFSLPAFDADCIPVVELGGSIGSNKFFVPHDAVLVSKLNPRIPRIWAPAEIPANSICSTEFLVLVPNQNVRRDFLAILCQSSTVSNQMKLHAVGTTGSHQRMQPAQALQIEVDVPTDSAEQAALARIFLDIDADTTETAIKVAKAADIKQGMMQQLLTGKIRLV